MPFRFSGAITRSVTTDGLSLCRAGLTRPRQCRYAARMISSCDFRFLCPMKWDEMADLPDGSGKHCAHCQRSVVTVHTLKEFSAAARFARANKKREDQIAAIFETLRGLMGRAFRLNCMIRQAGEGKASLQALIPRPLALRTTMMMLEINAQAMRTSSNPWRTTMARIAPAAAAAVIKRSTCFKFIGLVPGWL